MSAPKLSPTANTGPARSWSNTSRPAGWAAKRAAVLRLQRRQARPNPLIHYPCPALNRASTSLVPQGWRFKAWVAGTSPATGEHFSLLIQPGVFEAPAVENAVDHRRYVLDPRIPAGTEVVAIDDRSGGILGKLPVDLPNQLLALLLVRLH